VKTLFGKIDGDGDGTVTKEEAVTFWKRNWAKVNAQAMFNEVDDDSNGVVRKETRAWQPCLVPLIGALALRRIPADADPGLRRPNVGTHR